MMTKEEFLALLPEKVTVNGDHANNEVYVNGRPLNLEASLKIRNHSPSGFNWGYGGSGPAQFALALLLRFTEPEIASHYHQDLKFGWVAGLPQTDFELTINLRKIMTDILKDRDY